MNGRIANLIHGTRHAGLQVYSNLSVLLDLPLAALNLREGPAKEFCQLLRFKSEHYQLGDKIDDKVYSIGSFFDLDNDTAWVVGALGGLEHEPVSVSIFHRLLKQKLLYVASSYMPGKRLSSYVKYQKDGVVMFGNIEVFVKLFYVGEEKYFALVSPLEKEVAYQFEDFSVRHIHKCFFSDYAPHDIVSIKDISTVLFCLKLDGFLYLAEPVNDYEFE